MQILNSYIPIESRDIIGRYFSQHQVVPFPFQVNFRIWRAEPGSIRGRLGIGSIIIHPSFELISSLVGNTVFLESNYIAPVIIIESFSSIIRPMPNGLLNRSQDSFIILGGMTFQ